MKEENADLIESLQDQLNEIQDQINSLQGAGDMENVEYIDDGMVEEFAEEEPMELIEEELEETKGGYAPNPTTPATETWIKKYCYGRSVKVALTNIGVIKYIRAKSSYAKNNAYCYSTGVTSVFVSRRTILKGIATYYIYGTIKKVNLVIYFC